jgi:TPR repeat protein
MTDEFAVNTAANTTPVRGKPFIKGDSRINRKGRPRSFEAFRKLAIKIAGEQADEEDISRAVKMLRDMARSGNPADRALFLAYAYGKPKEEIENTGAVTLKVIYEDKRGIPDNTTETTPEAG